MADYIADDHAGIAAAMAKIKADEAAARTGGPFAYAPDKVVFTIDGVPIEGKAIRVEVDTTITGSVAVQRVNGVSEADLEDFRACWKQTAAAQRSPRPPERISGNPASAHYDSYWSKQADVFLDGKQVLFVKEAQAGLAGWIESLMAWHDPVSQKLKIGPEIERRRGHVEIRAKPGTEPGAPPAFPPRQAAIARNHIVAKLPSTVDEWTEDDMDFLRWTVATGPG